jgi:hypothetical protein
MKKTTVIGALALCCLLAPVAEAKDVLRVQARWDIPVDQDCTATLFLNSTQADVNVLELTYFGCPFSIVQGSGTVSISGNQNHLSVTGTIPTSRGEATIDLDFDRTGKLPRSPGAKTVSAVATGTVLVGGQDLTAGQPSGSASITKSKN